jgi:hypothetical protein
MRPKRPSWEQPDEISMTFMKTTITRPNGDRGRPESTADIWLCQPQPLRPHNRIACTACGNPFGEPWIRFFIAVAERKRYPSPATANDYLGPFAT